MAHTNETQNYQLPQFLGTDKPSWLTDVNQAFAAIDAGMQANKQAASTASENAGTAIATANTAKTAAENAQGNVQTAIDAANAANEKAEAAQTAATNAAASAQSAQASAITAAGSAQGAVTAAQNAQQTAQQANEEAQAAQTTAQNAANDVQALSEWTEIPITLLAGYINDSTRPLKMFKNEKIGLVSIYGTITGHVTQINTTQFGTIAEAITSRGIVLSNCAVSESNTFATVVINNTELRWTAFGEKTDKYNIRAIFALTN